MSPRNSCSALGVVVLAIGLGCGTATDRAESALCASTLECSASFTCIDGYCVARASSDDGGRPGGSGGFYNGPGTDGQPGPDAGVRDAGPPPQPVDASMGPDASGDGAIPGDSGGGEPMSDAGSVPELDAGTAPDSGSADAGGWVPVGADGGRDAGGPGESCRDNSECSPDLFCGGTGCTASGTCRLRTSICPTIYEPVCGCNGRTYSNSCVASSVGVRVQSSGACP